MSGRRAETIIDELDDLDGTLYDTTDADDDNTGGAEQDDNEGGRGSSGDSEGVEDHGAASRVSDGDRNADPANTGTPVNKGQQQQNPELRPLRNGMQQDAAGNLFDANGAMVARAGSERRLYERNARMGTMLDESNTRVQQLEQQIATLQQHDAVQRQYGLTPDDLTAGLPIIGEFKRDPLSAARRVVEMVASMGYNISDILGKDAGDAIELKAVSRMLDERLKPLNALSQKEENARREQENNRAAEQQVARFFEQHENAEMHAADIDRLLGLRPELTPERAYYELRFFAQKEGLDWNKPLAPQLHERMQSGQGAQSDNVHRQQQPTRQDPPMPNGFSRNAQRPIADSEYDDANSDWSDIIDSAMRSVNR